MTTDTRPKLASAKFRSGKTTVKLLGIAKGAGMIHPQLATMLVYLFTDVAGYPAELKNGFARVGDETFNCISIDGDTSTNDTVLLLATGRSGVTFKTAGVGKGFHGLAAGLSVSRRADLGGRRGRGTVIRLSVEQAKNREEALQVARTIAHSLLVKTAWAGADPNWGRILAAIGRSGIPVDPAVVSIMIGDQLVCRGGAACGFDENRAHQALERPSCDIRIRLGRGVLRSYFSPPISLPNTSELMPTIRLRPKVPFDGFFYRYTVFSRWR